MTHDFEAAREAEYAEFVRSLPPVKVSRSRELTENRIFRRTRTIEAHMEVWAEEWRLEQLAKAVQA